MCGRFALAVPPVSVAEHFSLPSVPSYPLRYNIAPSQEILVIKTAAEGNSGEAEWMKWGLIPPWAKDRKIGFKMINARSETIWEKPSFRSAAENRRCLIPATGFYEWDKATGQPYLIRKNSGDIFALAGLWERRRDTATGEYIKSCTILTKPAEDELETIHHRMPAIVLPEWYSDWLNPGVGRKEDVYPLLTSKMVLTIHPVSKKINNPRNDDISVMEKSGTYF